MGDNPWGRQRRDKRKEKKRMQAYYERQYLEDNEDDWNRDDDR